MGHARAIINIEDPDTQFMIFEQILKYDFSVRKVEEIVREIANPKPEVVEDEPVKPKRKMKSAITLNCSNISPGVLRPKWN